MSTSVITSQTGSGKVRTSPSTTSITARTLAASNAPANFPVEEEIPGQRGRLSPAEVGQVQREPAVMQDPLAELHRGEPDEGDHRRNRNVRGAVHDHLVEPEQPGERDAHQQMEPEQR